MKTISKNRLFKKILIPIVHGCESSSAINAGRAIAGADNVMLMGFVYVPEGESLSSAAVPAQEGLCGPRGPVTTNFVSGKS